MPQLQFTREQYQAAADVILSLTNHKPKVALILGSGLGVLADDIESPDIIPYAHIPNCPVSQVHGHKNQLVIGKLEGQTVLVQQGRAHFYEGWSMAQSAFLVRVMRLLGIHTLVVTNAAGAVNFNLDPGDLMLIRDHINFLGLVGNNPLVGENDEFWGERFPEMSTAYDRDLCALARQVAAQQGITLREGVYVGLAGPMFETPAETRMMRLLGGDAVGMSTVGEVTAARHAGLRVMGFSGITNHTIDNLDTTATVTHTDVLNIGKTKIVPTLLAVLRGVLRAMPAS
jgi:purine-nucleoside phosphorylase